VQPHRGQGLAHTVKYRIGLRTTSSLRLVVLPIVVLPIVVLPTPAVHTGAPAAAAPQGLGDGAYTPLRGVQRVVAVVGTAHVRGMVREWQVATEEAGESWEEAGSVAQLLKC
jgi:hypothetical protein